MAYHILKSEVFTVKEAKMGVLPPRDLEKYNKVRHTFLKMLGIRHPTDHKLDYVTKPCNVLARNGSNLSAYEKVEIMKFKNIYYHGEHCMFKLEVKNALGKCYECSIFDHLVYRFEIWDRICSGGSCVVYSAYDHKERRFVAVKSINRGRINYMQYLIEVDKLKKLRSIKNQNSKSKFAQLVGNFEFRGYQFIIMEKASCDLHTMIKNNKLTLETVRIFARDIMQCIEALVQVKIIHCDIKPDNFLVDMNKLSIKLTDFGLSRNYQDIAGKNIKQTLWYGAPESIMEGPCDWKIDIFACGVVIAEMLTGQVLLKGVNRRDQVTAMLELMGLPPKALLKRWPASKNVFDANGFPSYCDVSWDNQQNTVLTPKKEWIKRGRVAPSGKSFAKVLKTNDKDFADLVSQCLQWDPADRITPTRALLHRFLVPNIPGLSLDRRKKDNPVFRTTLNTNISKNF